MTVSEAMTRGVAMLQPSDEARADAQILMAHVLQRDREWLIAHSETLAPAGQVEKYFKLCEQRASGTPLAYIVGHAGFYKREFVVTPDVLVPRPETEHLVEDAIAFLQGKMDQDAPSKLFTVFEAGVGSGAIACTIAAEVPSAIVDGTDSSPAALKIAEINARRLDVQARCKFHVADVVCEQDAKRYDVVIANLPYIPSANIPQKPDPVGFEPRIALDGGPDGLKHYRKLLAAVPRLLRPGALLLMEAAPPTTQALRALTERALPGANVEVRRDYAALERYVYVKKGLR